MRDLTKSMVSYTWAMSVFGLQQTLNMLTPDGQAAGAKAMRSVADATAETFGPTLKAAYRAGDNLQAGMVDLMFGGFMSGGLDPNRWMRMAGDAMRQMNSWGQQAAQSAASAAGVGNSSQPGAAPGNGAPNPSGWGPMPR